MAEVWCWVSEGENMQLRCMQIRTSLYLTLYMPIAFSRNFEFPRLDSLMQITGDDGLNINSVLVLEIMRSTNSMLSC